MKIYDCTTFYSEHMMMDVRFSILDKYVEKFIVTESIYSHSGKRKKLNFDINNYPKFKNKIVYLIIEKEPNNLIEENNELSGNKRLNSIKRIEQSYDYMFDVIKDIPSDDLVILSDNDEIPNLESKKFIECKKNVMLFKQNIFYYKFNMLYDLIPWYGSKACKRKSLKSFSWLNNLKPKKYPLWRIDTYLTKNKLINLDIIDNGGWHFTNLKTPEELYEKFKNFGHHNEFDESGITVEKLKKYIDNNIVFYDHFVDQSNENKWSNNYPLKKVDDNILPKYLLDNKKKYKDWFC